ncbi:hypothetical protein CGCSCA4_v000956 [Colletotrichum siamense]|uniref:Uncharacterized protein n=1 Tax=Colletotrichum siamense TaxID=690259 RepID=A0A9P5F4Q3_COLSI|nr:hypothetical protein CGCSCA4_v000956 [Colletotrichum siamense]KAF4866276.1 hypothetical protein CGCSCA2_v001059 [Colletotrichum siamense]
MTSTLQVQPSEFHVGPLRDKEGVFFLSSTIEKRPASCGACPDSRRTYLHCRNLPPLGSFQGCGRATGACAGEIREPGRQSWATYNLRLPRCRVHPALPRRHLPVTCEKVNSSAFQ